MENRNLAQRLVDQGLDVNEKNEDGISSLDLARQIPDDSTRLGLLAALHRRPPEPELMPEGTSRNMAILFIF